MSLFDVAVFSVCAFKILGDHSVSKYLFVIRVRWLEFLILAFNRRAEKEAFDILKNRLFGRVPYDRISFAFFILSPRQRAHHRLKMPLSLGGL